MSTIIFESPGGRGNSDNTTENGRIVVSYAFNLSGDDVNHLIELTVLGPKKEFRHAVVLPAAKALDLARAIIDEMETRKATA
jgi:hypothetical protein